MSEEENYDRRRFLGTAAMAVAATRFGNFPGTEALAAKKGPAVTPPARCSS
jgi:nitrous oxide reductase